MIRRSLPSHINIGWADLRKADAEADAGNRDEALKLYRRAQQHFLESSSPNAPSFRRMAEESIERFTGQKKGG